MITSIAVLGAGTMGYGIAMNFALAGCTVRLVDMNDQVLQKARENIRNAMRVFVEEEINTAEECDEALTRIHTYTDRNAACVDVDMVIEALPERLELKQDVFLDLDSVCKAECIFVTNTSSLKLTDIMAKVSAARRQYCILAHYFNPAQIIPLVELLALEETLPQTVEKIEDLYRRANKVTVLLKKEVSGMVGNRIQGAICREAFWLLENGVCSYEDFGKVLMFGPCFRYATTDYLEIVDMGGLDIWYSVFDHLFKDLHSGRDASRLLRDKAEAGELGWKTGKGFYSYNGEKKEETLNRYVRNLAKQLKVSENYKRS